MNPFEQSVADALEQAGWHVTRNGWPDFLCWRVRNGKKEIVGVEAKSPTDSLRPEQIVNHELLAECGFTVHVLKASDFGVGATGATILHVQTTCRKKRNYHTGGLIKRKGCRFWVAQFYKGGRAIRVSTRTAVKAEAEAILRRLMVESEKTAARA